MTDKYAMRGPPHANEKAPAGVEVAGACHSCHHC